MKQIFYIVFFLFTTQIFFAQTEEEKKMLGFVNELRQNRGLQTVRFNTALNKACRDHSKDMADNDYFEHRGSNGSRFWERAEDAGYIGSPASENIAAGNSLAKNTFNQWFTSSGHLTNMLNPDVNEMGIGYAYNRNSEYRHYWTQIFGKGTTLSNEDFEDKVLLSVYPNPVKDNLNIKFKKLLDDEIKIELVSITGKIVFNRTENNSKTAVSLNIENLTSGVYFLRINSSNKVFKIIKI